MLVAYAGTAKTLSTGLSHCGATPAQDTSHAHPLPPNASPPPSNAGLPPSCTPIPLPSLVVAKLSRSAIWRGATSIRRLLRSCTSTRKTTTRPLASATSRRFREWDSFRGPALPRQEFGQPCPNHLLTLRIRRRSTARHPLGARLLGLQTLSSRRLTCLEPRSREDSVTSGE